jgi:large subunit ribosomal protein L17
MRHGDKINNLNRTASHRKAMLANMASSLILHKRIKTTLPKAKALRTYVEPLLSKAKTSNNTTIEQSTHQKRTVFAYLRSKEVIKELFSTVAEAIGERPGGYTRIIKLGTRPGDNAEICIIELVDFNESFQKENRAAGKKTRRKRGAKKTETTAVEASSKEKPAADNVVEDKTEE